MRGNTLRNNNKRGATSARRTTTNNVNKKARRGDEGTNKENEINSQFEKWKRATGLESDTEEEEEQVEQNDDNEEQVRNKENDEDNNSVSVIEKEQETTCQMNGFSNTSDISRNEEKEALVVPIKNRKRLTEEEETTLAAIRSIVKQDIFPKVKFIAGINHLELNGRIAEKILTKAKIKKEEERKWWNKYSLSVRKTMDTMRAAAGHELKVQWQGKKQHQKKNRDEK